MHENECNLAGDTKTLNDDISGVIHCIRFILWDFYDDKDQTLSQAKNHLRGVL